MTSIRLTVIPHLPELGQIKELRKKLNISQRELAKRAGVSQSLIAKIENGAIDPSFNKVRQIFEALEEVFRTLNMEGKTNASRLTIYDLATKGVVSASPDESVGRVVDKMMEGRYTQLPVMEDGKVVGSVTDDLIRSYTIEATRSGIKTYDEVMETPVKEIMEPPFSILRDDTPIDLASMHLQQEEAVLVSKNGEIVGILTSADFLNLGLRY